jgi:cytochrome b6-f complex subunit 7
MGGEIFSSGILIFVLTLVGLGVGFLMLRLQGGEE